MLDASPFIAFLGLKVTEADPAKRGGHHALRRCGRSSSAARAPASGMAARSRRSSTRSATIALVMALGRGLPTINFRVDYLRPAIKTGLITTAHGAPQRQERRRRRRRRVQRQEGAARRSAAAPIRRFGCKLAASRGWMTPRRRTGSLRWRDEGKSDEQVFDDVSVLMTTARRRRSHRALSVPPPSAQGDAKARRHAGRDLGRRRAAGLLRAGRRRLEPDLLLVQAVRAAGQPHDGRRIRAVSWRRSSKPADGLQVYTVKLRTGREVPRRQADDRRRRRLLDRRDLEEVRRRLGASPTSPASRRRTPMTVV